jgi:hypothetical protein
MRFQSIPVFPWIIPRGCSITEGSMIRGTLPHFPCGMKLAIRKQVQIQKAYFPTRSLPPHPCLLPANAAQNLLTSRKSSMMLPS